MKIFVTFIIICLAWLYVCLSVCLPLFQRPGRWFCSLLYHADSGAGRARQVPAAVPGRAFAAVLERRPLFNPARSFSNQGAEEAKKYKGTADAFKQLYKEAGLRSLFRGTTATWLRD